TLSRNSRCSSSNRVRRTRLTVLSGHEQGGSRDDRDCRGWRLTVGRWGAGARRPGRRSRRRDRRRLGAGGGAEAAAGARAPPAGGAAAAAVIAADSGLEPALKLGLDVTAVVGDMDSVDPGVL